MCVFCIEEYTKRQGYSGNLEKYGLGWGGEKYDFCLVCILFMKKFNCEKKREKIEIIMYVFHGSWRRGGKQRQKTEDRRQRSRGSFV